MDVVLWVVILIAILLLAIGIVFVFNSKKGKGKKRGPDYYSFFIMGIIWIAIGIPLNNKFLWIFGAILFIIGIVNKKKWKENRVKWDDLTEKEKKVRKWLIGLALLLLVLGVLFFFLFATKLNEPKMQITNFQECIDAGYPAMESYPRQCNDGKNTYIEEVISQEILNAAQNSECGEKGILTGEYYYNNFTKTWWLELTIKPEFENPICNPACVVIEDSLEAEINWMCTGALV